MAASVQVLCPNGRRQTVKVTQNTKLLQVLEEVCQRQGFIPPEDFKLIQGRKELDLSLSIRFSSLPNNAKLELAKSTTARIEQEVTIALQLDSGQRLQDKFVPSTALWDLLLHFEENNRDYKGQLTKVENMEEKCLHPVCIFMREEVIGEQALKATTLKKLALTSGKAIIRLLHRPIEKTTMAEISDQVEKDKARQARLEEIAQRKKEVLDEREREDNLKSSMTERLLSVKEEGNETSSSGKKLQQQQREKEEQIVEAMDVDREDDHDDDSLSSQTTSVDMSSRNRSLHTKLSTPSSSQPHPLQSDPMQDLRNLNIPGMEIFTPDDFSDLNPIEQTIARRLAQRFLPHLQGSSSSSNPTQPHSGPLQDEQSANAFLTFKFPEETKGKDLSETQGSSSSIPDSSPCDRNTLVYNASEALSVSSQELPEDFFDVTQSDVRLMYRDLQNAVRKMDDEPLITKTMKQAMSEAAYDHYQQVIIRVHFPDKMVTQACFRPRETVGALHSFVRGCLHDKNLQFYLYTTPPKTVLKDMKSSLALNHLAPAALVYFGCQEERDHYIHQDLSNNTKSRLEAETCAAKVLKQGDDDSPNQSATPTSNSDTNLHTAGPSGISTGRLGDHFSSSSSPSTLPSGAKVPKWLKLGKK